MKPRVAVALALCLASASGGCAFSAQHVESAVSLERQAEAALSAGNPERALSIYNQAATRWREAGEFKIYAATLDSIARIHKNAGDFDLAVDAWQQALSVAKHIHDTDTVLRTLGNLGIAHSAWGRYKDALDYYEESLELAKTLKHEASLARLYNNIGSVYRHQGKLDEALESYQKALGIDRRLKDELAVATRMANIGTVYMDRGDYERAHEHYESALTVARKSGLEDKIAIRLNNLGAVSVSRGNYEEALRHYEEALRLHTKLDQRHEVATVLSNMGSVYWYLDRYHDASQSLKKSIDIKDDLRKGAAGDIRRDYLASQIDTYEWLTSTYARASEPKKGLLAADSSRAKYLFDQLQNADSKATIEEPSVLAKRFLKRLPEDVAVIYFANAGWNRLIRFIATSGGVVTATEIDTSVMLAKLAPSGGDLGDATQLKGNREALAEAIRAYRKLLTSSAPSDDAERNRQASIFHDSLLGDGTAFLNRRHLVFVPDASLAFIPFETLRSKDRYLIEDRFVTYTPSLAVSELIEMRKESRGERSLLALGDARYEGVAMKVGIDKLKKDEIAWNARQRDVRGLTLTDSYAELGYASWLDLPGTRKEVVGITELVSDSRVLLGTQVSEARIKKMSQNKSLANYRMIHVATHGITSPENPSLSALVLSQTEELSKQEDGYLTMREIAKLVIDADQVVLSACNTGLGKLYAGEGVVGLTQAFFVAGARAVSVSLWAVPDDSTAELMLRAYKAMKDKHESFAVAMVEAKRSFINGSAGDPRLSRPYHWAPFVHYGTWKQGSP